MSYHVHFSMSTGLAKPLRVPAGTKAEILAHVRDVEKTLGLKTTQYRDNPAHWMRNDFADLSDEVLCDTASKHNRFVVRLYEQFAEWSEKPVKGGEKLTPADAAEFWHGLQKIEVPPDRWNAGYYREQMERVYEVMRGRPADGVTFDGKPLTTEQAVAVIILFSEFLDTHDIRIDVPVGHDHLACSDEYAWCEKCGAIADDEIDDRVRCCRKRGGCPIREQYGN